jgi:hypothetical protein
VESENKKRRKTAGGKKGVISFG